MATRQQVDRCQVTRRSNAQPNLSVIARTRFEGVVHSQLLLRFALDAMPAAMHQRRQDAQTARRERGAPVHFFEAEVEVSHDLEETENGC